MNKNLGLLLTGIYLVLAGLGAFVPALAGMGTIWAILAIAAGVLLILGR